MGLFGNLFKRNTQNTAGSELENKINEIKNIVVSYGSKIDCKEGVGYSHTIGVGDMSMGQSILIDDDGYLCGMELYGKKNSENEGQNVTVFFNGNSIDFEKTRFSVINTETRQILFSEKCEIESLKHTVDAHHSVLNLLEKNKNTIQKTLIEKIEEFEHIINIYSFNEKEYRFVDNFRCTGSCNDEYENSSSYGATLLLTDMYMVYVGVKVKLNSDISDEIIFEFYMDEPEETIEHAKRLCTKISSEYPGLSCGIKHNTVLCISAKYESDSSTFSGKRLLDKLDEIKGILESKYICELNKL